MFGLAGLPAIVITLVLVAAITWLPGVSPLVDFASGSGGTSIVFAGFAGSVANVLAFVVINAVVALHLDGGGVDEATDAARRGWSHWRPLLGAYARSFAIVFVLLVSFIGIPWGIRQLVRYQFVSQSVALEDRSGGDALRRSSELVRGRWLHTAVVTAVVNATIAVVALTAALLLLVVAAGLPLWLFSLLNGVVYVATMPLGAIAMSLLYGDAVAESREASTDSVHEPVPA